MAIGDDFSVAHNGDIRRTGDAHGGGAPGYYTVLELHRWLQDLADDENPSTIDDLHDITDNTSSDRATDNIITLLNGYNLDDDAAEYFYDGSITQDGGDTVYSGVVVVGAVETGTEIQIVQDNALLTNYWGTGLNTDAANAILLRLMVKTRANGADIDGKRLRVQARELGDTYAEFSFTAGLGNATAALFTATDLNNQTAGGTIGGWTITNTEGYQLIDVTGDGSDEPYYSQWDPGVQSINDLYEYTKYIQRRGSAETIHTLNGQLFRGITHQFDYDNEVGTFQENEIVVWGTSFNYDNEAVTNFTVGEYLSFGTSGAVGKLIQLTDAGTTGSMVVAIESGSGTVVDNDPITGLTSGATADVNGVVTNPTVSGGQGLVLALDDNGTTGTFWIQLLTGSAPADNLPLLGVTSGATADNNGGSTQRTVSPAFVGASTGSNLIGAFGIGVTTADLTVGDQLTDLLGVLNEPPNNVTFTVNGLVSGEDRVLVTPESGGTIDATQFTLNTALTGAAETSIVMTAAIPTDTPSSGTLRIITNSGEHKYQTYTSYTGSTFTIPSTDYSGDNASATNNAYLSYIDKLAAATSESFTGVYSADRALFIRVRDGGVTPIKTFETTGTLGSAGGSTTAIRTSDA